MVAVTLPLWALADGHNATDDAGVAADRQPGYMIVIGNGVNPAGMRDYAAAAVPLIIKAGGKLLFATEEGKTEVLEGGPFPGSIRVFEFPSLQAARDFYYADAYQAAIPLRAGNGRIDVMVADGWVPDPKWFREPAETAE
jgi:uncharacterized protein (DUF1330 family)